MLILPFVKVLEVENVPVQSVTMMSVAHAGVVGRVSFRQCEKVFYKLTKTVGMIYLVILGYGKEHFRFLLAVLFTAVWYLIYKCTSLTSEFTASKCDYNRTGFVRQVCVVLITDKFAIGWTVGEIEFQWGRSFSHPSDRALGPT